MAAQAFDIAIVHERDATEWVERLARGLEESGLRSTRADAAFVDRNAVDPVLRDARILVVAVGPTLGTVIDAAEIIRDAGGRSAGDIVPVQLPGAGLGTASVLGRRTGQRVYDLGPEDGFDERVADFAKSLGPRIAGPGTNASSPQESQAGAADAPAPAEDDALAVIARRTLEGSGAVLEKAWELARLAGQTRVHEPHLIQAIYEEDPTSRAAIARVADSPDRFLAELAERSKRTERSAAGRAVPGLPNLSGHVTDGLVAAAHEADVGGSAVIASIHLLVGMLSVTSCSTVKALQEHGITADRVRAAIASTPTNSAGGTRDDAVTPGRRDYVAGYASDSVAGRDLLGITNEVEALATLLASRALEPPLALGLFGDWGTGKTFFMAKLQDRIREKALYEQALHEKGKPPVRTGASYCESIVQLTFNAWHYIDKELWASLANAIFEGLDEAVTTKDLSAGGVETRAQKRIRLLAERDANRQSLEAVTLDQATKLEAVQAATARLVELDAADEALARSVSAAEVMAAIYRVAVAVPEVGKEADDISSEIDRQLESVAGTLGMQASDLRSDLPGVARVGGRVGTGLRSPRRRGRVVLWALVAAVPVGALVLLNAGWPLAGLATAVTGLLAGLGAAWVAAAPVVKILADARRESRALIEKKRDEAKRAVVAKRVAADAAVADGQAEIKSRQDHEAELDAQIRLTEPGREMAQFIRMRRASTAYSSRLGVVAQARDDFEQLSAYLAADARDTPVVDERTNRRLVPPVERIVLYIDDLDRCTEKQVVDVLQAVHLLLAFKLFVVVVAVDPRWLLHSLRVRSRVVGAAPGEADLTEQPPAQDDVEQDPEWEATPMDYLEKIFQIPFALWPMDGPGFARVIAELSQDSHDGTADSGTGGGDDATPDADRQTADRDGRSIPTAVPDGGTEAGTVTGGVTVAGQASNGDAQPGGDATRTGGTTPEAPGGDTITEVDPDILRISDAEQAFMTLLHPLIPTPRSAKRFVNVYRLLKASKIRETGLDFEAAPTHRPVLLLLAIVTGYPELAPAILEGLYRARSDKSLVWDLVAAVSVAEVEETGKANRARVTQQWADLVTRLNEVRALLTKADAQPTPEEAPLDGRLLGEWALAVARYSFEASRVLVQYRTMAADPGATVPETPPAAG